MGRMRKATKNLLIVGAGTAAIYGMLKAIAKRQAEDESIDDDNPYLRGKAAKGEKLGKQARETSAYESKVKPMLDQILSFGGLVALAPLYVAIALAIKIDDPGPAFFTQKRIGKGKRFFYCHKFRTMKMCTPHDVPTHQLSDPDQYITRIGRFLRRTSLDELPQGWDIFRQKMSTIGPRPALWNQDDLVAERDRYGANDVLPGLTGWAQINGRDELEIPEKARLDGEYVRKLRQGGWVALFFDVRCFIGTILSVVQSKGVVEGGTGSMDTEDVKNKKTLIGMRPLGNTGIMISELGFGCASVWGKNMITDQQAQELFERAYDLGIRYFDTGHSYGNAEERIGKILKNSKIVKRENIVISTKFGTRLVNGRLVHDVSPDWIKQSVSLSLERMGISYIDCVQIHGPTIHDFTDELYGVLDDLKREGLVKAVGANSFDTEVLEHICNEKKLDFVMLDYNIMRQDREALIQRFCNNGIGVVGGAALAESLYSNRVFRVRSRKDIWYLARTMKNFRRQLVKGRKYRFINRLNGMTGSQVALKYVLNNPMISAAVFGTTTMSHLEENVGAVGIEIPEDVLCKIKANR